MSEGKKQLSQWEVDPIIVENQRYKKKLAVKDERLKDLETLVLWSARRLKGPHAAYVLEELEKNRRMEEI